MKKFPIFIVLLIQMYLLPFTKNKKRKRLGLYMRQKPRQRWSSNLEFIAQVANFVQNKTPCCLF